MKHFSILTLQASIFVDDFLKDEDIKEILDYSGFKGTLATMLPIPSQEATAQVVVASIAKGKLKANIARKRLDFFYSVDGQDEDLAIGNSKLGDIYKFVLGKPRLSEMANRISYVTQYYNDAITPQQLQSLLNQSVVPSIVQGKAVDVAIKYITRSSGVDLKGGVDFEVNNHLSVAYPIRIASIKGRDAFDATLLIRDFNTNAKKAAEYKGKFTVDSLGQLTEFAAQKTDFNKLETVLYERTKRSGQ